MSKFSYSPIDRDAHIRHDSEQVLSRLNSDNSRILLWHHGCLLRRLNGLLFFNFADVLDILDQLSDPVYLGVDGEVSYFTFDLKQRPEKFKDCETISLRSISRQVQEQKIGLLFYAQGILNWHQSHAFCANCGSSTKVTQAGHARKCVNDHCDREHYPRISPAVIFPIINKNGAEQKILLARQPGWDEGRHSVIAGFAEPGESLEDTVRREAYEETGLVVKNVEYVDSQPWPFPGALMVGFVCETDQTEIHLLDQELESAHWFSADELEAKLKSGELKMPFDVSISWHLIDRWFIEQKGYSVNDI